MDGSWSWFSFSYWFVCSSLCQKLSFQSLLQTTIHNFITPVIQSWPVSEVPTPKSIRNMEIMLPKSLRRSFLSQQPKANLTNLNKPRKTMNAVYSKYQSNTIFVPCDNVFFSFAPSPKRWFYAEDSQMKSKRNVISCSHLSVAGASKFINAIGTPYDRVSFWRTVVKEASEVCCERRALSRISVQWVDQAVKQCTVAMNVLVDLVNGLVEGCFVSWRGGEKSSLADFTPYLCSQIHNLA